MEWSDKREDKKVEKRERKEKESRNRMKLKKNIASPGGKFF